MQNMDCYFDFSGQKFGYPLSLSINRFEQRVFSSQPSLEISYVLKGEYEVITEHFTATLKEQELVIIAPNDIHMLRQMAHTENTILTLHIDFALFAKSMVGDIDKSFESMVCSREQNFKLLAKLKQKIGLLVDSLLLENPNLFRLNAIMMDLLDIASNHQEYPIERLSFQSEAQENYQKALQYISQHYQEELRLEDIAELLSFSVSYTSKLLKKYTGVPFVKYLSHVRIRASMDALLSGKDSIETIACACGMANSKAYTMAFKELFHIVPSAYRKQILRTANPPTGLSTHVSLISDKQRLLIQHLISETNEILYENSGICIRKKEDEILCKIQTGNHVKTVISHDNQELILTVRKK